MAKRLKDLAASFVLMNFRDKSSFEINLFINIINTFVEQLSYVKHKIYF